MGLVCLKGREPQGYGPAYLVGTDEQLLTVIVGEHDWDVAKSTLGQGQAVPIQAVVLGSHNGGLLDPEKMVLQLVLESKESYSDGKTNYYKARLTDYQYWDDKSFSVIEKVAA
jgi:hypothetical protein